VKLAPLPLALLVAGCAAPPPLPPPPPVIEVGDTRDLAVGRLGVIEVCAGSCAGQGPAIVDVDVNFDERAGTWLPGDAPHRVRVLVPTSVEAEPGARPLKLAVTVAGGVVVRREVELEVTDVAYKTNELRVKKRFVEPPEEERARIEAERKSIRVALEDPYPARLWAPPLHRPVKKVVTAPFGTLRLYNNKKRSRHRGLDLDGRTGDPIEALAAGRVSLVEDRYYSGGTVVLDHGDGLFSLYFHMSRFDVRAGDMVQRGQLIGAVGRSGRVTGPHLHLGVKLGDLYLDPRAAMELLGTDGES
jgi:murein DD-endopeptidase MepM/ murein hydrolase activator NlpD